MNHYPSLGKAPYYDRTRDPYMRRFFKSRGGGERIKLTGDPVTGHLARDEIKRAMRYSSCGIWKNRHPGREIPSHPKFAPTSCTDCNSGGYCRCPVQTSITDQYSNAPSAYSRELQPPSPSQQTFLKVSKRIFSAPNSPGSPNMLMTASPLPQDTPGSPGMPPPLSTAILYAGHAAARRHVERPPLCGGGLVTSVMPRGRKSRSGPRPLTVDTASLRERAQGFKPHSDFKRRI